MIHLILFTPIYVFTGKSVDLKILALDTSRDRSRRQCDRVSINRLTQV